MKRFFQLTLFSMAVLVSRAQSDSISRTRFVAGLSAPELLHIGVNYDLAKFSQLGFSAGIGPSWGGVWPTLNLEHRLYLGKTSQFTNRKQLFFRQGVTWFTASDNNQYSLNLTVGGDLKSKSPKRGWTIDGGLLILFQDDTEMKTMVLPALRFQYYS